MDDYPKQVEYRKSLGKDKMNQPKYDDPVIINVRYCGEKNESKVGVAQSIEHYGIYHSPIKLLEDSKLDNKRIEQVSPKPDVFGNIQYYRIKVV